MRKNLNTERIEGYIYQLGDSNGRDVLTEKVSGQGSKNPGTKYIAGTIEVAVDEDGLNIIPVHFTYVTPTYSSGKENRNFNVLSQIIANPKTWLSDGKEGATKIRIDASLGLNDFYSQDGSLVSSKRNEGSFVSIVTNLAPETERNTFKTDMVISAVTHVDADPEKNISADYTVVRGGIFDFRNAWLPLEYVVKNPAGMKYFESLEASNSNPIYTQVQGRINCSSEKVEIVEESAFGEPTVTTKEKRVREWVVTSAAKNPYDFGEENVMTAEELVKCLQDREIYLADVKKRAEDYKASKTSAPSPVSTAPATAAPKAQVGSFNF